MQRFRARAGHRYFRPKLTARWPPNNEGEGPRHADLPGVPARMLRCRDPVPPGVPTPCQNPLSDPEQILLVGFDEVSMQFARRKRRMAQYTRQKVQIGLQTADPDRFERVDSSRNRFAPIATATDDLCDHWIVE